MNSKIAELYNDMHEGWPRHPRLSPGNDEGSLKKNEPVRRPGAAQALGRTVLPIAMLSPAVLVTVVIVFLPMLQTAWMSLHDYILFRPRSFDFVGLKNFIAAFHDEVFWISLRHTLIWILLTVPAAICWPGGGAPVNQDSRGGPWPRRAHHRSHGVAQLVPSR